MPFPVLVHPYESPTEFSCAYEYVTANSASARNAVIFIGGLGDGPHAVPYPRPIAEHLAGSEASRALSYSVFEFRMTSSFGSFSFHRLADDVADIAAVVKYVRSLGREKIVLLGHSTGCQDLMKYAESVSKDESPAVEAYVLQAPVSDREAFVSVMEPEFYEKTLAATQKMIAEGRENDFVPHEHLPSLIKGPCTAFRWHSFIGKNTDDDYFSSDLPDSRLVASWKCFDKPLMLLQSAEDEYVPKTIDVGAKLARWKTFCAPGVYSELSGSIPGTGHRVDSPEAQKWMAKRLVSFLTALN